MELAWLPAPSTSALPSLSPHPLHSLSPESAAKHLREWATSRLDLPTLIKLDRLLIRTLATHGGELPGLEPLRLAVLGSSTTSHLLPGLRVAGLRHGLALEIYQPPFNSYRQELADHQSGLHLFFPQAILFAFDAHYLAAFGSTAAALDEIGSAWRLAQASFPAQIVQQTALPVLLGLLGNHEERLPDSGASILWALNEQLRPAAAKAGVDLLSLDRLVLNHGLQSWYDPALWYRAKQEIHPAAAALYGDHVARLLGAARGHSAKVLVLDLDHTLWGGGIGDDGLEGILLGQGSALGEAHLALQQYALDLKRRGILLAVCSKNDETNALEPFLRHPDMLLRRDDIAVFIANWTDKATNLRTIASRLNLGLDALVFVDDNPAERALARRELPEVRVPEMPDDPALFVSTLAAAGYFEATFLTAEDHLRPAIYAAERRHKNPEAEGTDLPGYLASLDMLLTAQPIDELSLRRATQLVNKTNQFNLLTHRLTEAEIRSRSLGLESAHWITLACRLTDRFGDHGLIAVLMARLRGTGLMKEALIEDWLMSCRVLGRQVEDACLNLLVERALAVGARTLTGLYRPTAKNSQVRDLYLRLGFQLAARAPDGYTRWTLDLNHFTGSQPPLRSEYLATASV